MSDGNACGIILDFVDMGETNMRRASQRLKVMVGGVGQGVRTSMLLMVVMNQSEKAKDGFLYILVSSESTFG